MNIDGWTIGKDERGFFAHEPRGPSTVRVTESATIVRTNDGGCNIPSKVMGTLESLIGCNCNPLEQTGGVHKHDCPAHQAEWETVT